MRKGLIQAVENVEGEELEASMTFELMNSNHEGAAMIQDELEEAADELYQVRSDFNDIWNDIKANGSVKMKVSELYKVAIRSACECVQVAAMCHKFLNSPKCK